MKDLLCLNKNIDLKCPSSKNINAIYCNVDTGKCVNKTNNGKPWGYYKQYKKLNEDGKKNYTYNENYKVFGDKRLVNEHVKILKNKSFYKIYNFNSLKNKSINELKDLYRIKNFEIKIEHKNSKKKLIEDFIYQQNETNNINIDNNINTYVEEKNIYNIELYHEFLYNDNILNLNNLIESYL